jgi:hypothetical protein
MITWFGEQGADFPTLFTSKVITLSQISMSVWSPFYGRASDLADLDMAKVSYRSSIKHYAEGS